MLVTLTLWSHAIAALLFGALALAQVRRAGEGLPRFAFLVALAMTSLWALAIAGIGGSDLTSRIAESVRNIAWLAFMMALVRRDRAAPAGVAVAVIYGIVVLLILAGGVLTVASVATSGSIDQPGIETVAVILRMMVAVTALVLVNHLYNAVAPAARGGIRLAMIALAAMWAVDLGLYTLGYLGVGSIAALVVMRGVAMAFIAPLFGLAAHRNGDWTLKLSRTVAYQSLSLAATGLYVLVLALATSAIAAVGGSQVRILQTAFVFGSTAALLTIVSTPWLRAWTKVKLAKHLFTHRYDYRAEWVRFTDTIGKPGDGVAPLDERIVKAVADLTDSPAGLLLVPDGDGAGIGIGAPWNWIMADTPVQGADSRLARYLESTGRIIELDAVRSDGVEPAEIASVPQWMLDRADAWVLVPLVHFGKLVGAILLARPPVDRSPDWEDLDLLRIAGRQVASYLAEARSHEALSDAQRFDEFNRRFAFIMHDIKNIVSQLSLVARNAERHAENPDFRADMIATLQDSAARMNDLLARLSQHHSGRADLVAPMEVLPIVERAAARRRALHPIATSGPEGALALADAARVEQILGHLLQNAIEASPHGEPVMIAVGQDDSWVTIDVIDRGAGMSPAFVRDRLFKPFVSTKQGGFGLGAFEARQLAEAMGGRVEVASREGEGSRFRLSLPTAYAHAAVTGKAA